MCNRLSGYSGYSDIHKKPIHSNTKVTLLGKIGYWIFLIFEITGLRFSIRMYLGIRHRNRQFAHYSNTFLNVISAGIVYRIIGI